MHEYMSDWRIWELTCPGLPEEIGRARRWTRDVLRDSPHADDAALIVSELGSNALVHSASGSPNGSFHVSLHRSPGTVVLAVTDTGGGATKPHVATPDEDDTHGRGLGLVAALANCVRVTGDDYGRTVTVEISDQHQAPARPSARGVRVGLPAPRSMA
ncbi:ATP-binding protein [Streptomyces tubbatahanensis]|uniref:ATP-binding protein n=1 Tax=Streptomyces tubbatahanensis TaxID=2923272 RepID=A0ABY3XU76_9ACTN|nr:ATP-binding protein [Streptomyces tubbatahanensis]UNS98032.1 ATP-binding protein [Streptomyces tubbatahanensis]